MFLISALYHHASDVVWKSRWRIMDHICIYLLIAGTYTPLALITLERDNGWTIFYTVWGLAGLDTVLKLFYTGKYETISLSLYVAMGWLIVLDFENVLSYTSARGLGLLFAGGIFYTVGILFYAVDRIPYNHFIWHLFVLAGAVSHWFFIYLDIV
jgi:hemolysin III